MTDMKPALLHFRSKLCNLLPILFLLPHNWGQAQQDTVCVIHLNKFLMWRFLFKAFPPYPPQRLCFADGRKPFCFTTSVITIWLSPGYLFFQDYSSSNVSFGKRKISWSVPGNRSSALCNKESRAAVAPVRSTLDWGVTGRHGVGRTKTSVSMYKAMP